MSSRVNTESEIESLQEQVSSLTQERTCPYCMMLNPKHLPEGCHLYAKCPECGTFADHIPHGEVCRFKEAEAEADRRIALLTQERDDARDANTVALTKFAEYAEQVALLTQERDARVSVKKASAWYCRAKDAEAQLAELDKLIDELARLLEESDCVCLICEGRDHLGVCNYYKNKDLSLGRVASLRKDTT